MNEMHISQFCQFSRIEISCFFKNDFIVYLSWNTFSDFVIIYMLLKPAGALHVDRARAYEAIWLSFVEFRALWPYLVKLIVLF